MQNTWIEYKNGTTPEKQNVKKDFKTILHTIALRKFTGQVNVYNGTILCYSMSWTNGALDGKFVKYCEYKPSTWSGMLSGYVSRNWRQPQIEMTFKSDVIDGPVLFYKDDGSRHFLLNYKMGILQGEQKHYTSDITRVVHLFHEGKWVQSSKQYKNWIPRWHIEEADEIVSHKSIKGAANTLSGMFSL